MIFFCGTYLVIASAKHFMEERNMKPIVFCICIMTFWFSGDLVIATTSGTAPNTLTQENQGSGDSPGYMVPSVMSRRNQPCAKCHDYRKEDRRKRDLAEYHSDIQLQHAEEQRWCYDCHDGDKLRLQNKQIIDFNESYLLCGQCHGTILRDWKAGIHGKRSGSWDGDKLYRVCSSCHDPHQPKFKAIKPKQPPVNPSDL